MSTSGDRAYPQKDLKILFAKAAGRCSYPNCRAVLIQDATPQDPAAQVGLIAHIYAHSNNGPRANSTLTQKERDCYKNWILLCGLHHDIIDCQANTYTAAELQRWKDDHENWLSVRLLDVMPTITHAEFEIVVKRLLKQPAAPPTQNFMLTTPREKLARNNLSALIEKRIQIGMLQEQEVGRYVEHIIALDPGFPEQLKSGFVEEYDKLYADGYRGDDLFEALHQATHSKDDDFDKIAAALAVIVYLFLRCELFAP